MVRNVNFTVLPGIEPNVAEGGEFRDALTEAVEYFCGDERSATTSPHVEAGDTQGIDVPGYGQPRNTRHSVILYYGSKSGMVDWILSLMPPHEIYVEPFGGSGALLFAKDPAKVNVYNDLDGNLCEFFRILKDREKARLIRYHLEMTPYSRQVYDDCVERFDSITDEIEWATAFLLIANQSFNAKFGRGWKHSKACNCPTPYYRALQLIESTVRRLQRVQVEHYDFERVIGVYDSPSTLFLCDPPYVEDTRIERKVYRHEMSYADHERLLQTVVQVQGMVMLCGYSHPLYEDTLRGWDRYEQVVTCRSAASAKATGDPGGKDRTEVIWINPHASDALKRVKKSSSYDIQF